MSNLKECGSGSSGVEIIDDDEEVSSCYSQFYSTNEQEDEDEDEMERVSDCSIILDVVTILPPSSPYGMNNRDCRICHLSLLVDKERDGDGDDDAIELGCCCKNDLAAAHKHCALTWFKIKGNKVCEICNSIASNLVVSDEMPSVHGTTDVLNPVLTGGGRGVGRGGQGRGGCINGHRLLNFILACLVFAFVISWLFHFNIPS